MALLHLKVSKNLERSQMEKIINEYTSVLEKLGHDVIVDSSCKYIDLVLIENLQNNEEKPIYVYYINDETSSDRVREITENISKKLEKYTKKDCLLFAFAKDGNQKDGLHKLL
jgi:hypothetical protein